MTTSRLAVLLAVLLGGLSAVFLLPKQHTFDQPTGIDLVLPKMVDGVWYGRDLKVSDGERSTLGFETEFCRKSYTNARGDEIQASIVLAGRDMNTSIHRPEWCLPAQGWTIADSGPAVIPLPERGVLATTRLHNMRLLRHSETGKPLIDKDGHPVMLRNLDYYWFVGYKDTTPSHTRRNLIDISDRLLEGYNQRWAFITIMSTVTEGLRPNGLTIEQTDDMLKNFIQKLIPLTHKETVKFR